MASARLEGEVVVLTADLLRGTIRSGRLYLPPIKGKRRREMTTLAQSYSALIEVMEGVCRDEVVDALRSIELPSRDRIIGLGLQKLLLDRCEFLMPQGPDPRQLRGDLFRLAAKVRASLADDEVMDRQALVRQVSDSHGITTEQLESLLYADLKGTHLLATVPHDTPEQL
ncbi:MAG TPA: hypothetical protein DCQ06_07865, partial [Myxococcales bacterium]|nr:hypothetical protein [Myxococcales bacterium]